MKKYILVTTMLAASLHLMSCGECDKGSLDARVDSSEITANGAKGGLSYGDVAIDMEPYVQWDHVKNHYDVALQHNDWFSREIDEIDGGVFCRVFIDDLRSYIFFRWFLILPENYIPGQGKTDPLLTVIVNMESGKVVDSYLPPN